jgi:HD superfamily phosphohydrolase
VTTKKKIINDPIYGFVTIENDLIFDLIEHRYFQRLRRIKQLGLTNLVYPGANHTRFHHAIGAMHLMTKAIGILRSKGVEVTDVEEEAALAAILLHDIGHGPFSHVMEHAIVQDIEHEQISLAFMKLLNREFNGRLDDAIRIFEDTYPKKFLHQLVSSQLDVDRLDYLTRDSFYTGVSEGIIGLDRIIEMLNVSDDQLVIDEKGIYSVEKFIVARRLMYWQVYLHKTTIAADGVLLNALKRARHLSHHGQEVYATPALSYFLHQSVSGKDINSSEESLNQFSALDDTDIIVSIKNWQNHSDKVLSYLSKAIVNRRLLKIKITNDPISPIDLQELTYEVARNHGLTNEEATYLIFEGELNNAAYQSTKEEIMIRKKSGELIDLGTASINYNFVSANSIATKYFVCSPK